MKNDNKVNEWVVMGGVFIVARGMLAISPDVADAMGQALLMVVAAGVAFFIFRAWINS